MKKHSGTTVYKQQQLWFFAASLLFISTFILYIYFVSASVVHVVMRKELDQDITRVSSYISQLEADYIAAQHSVSEDIAFMDGYVVTDEKIFIDRTKTSLVLSTGNGS